MRKIPGNTPTLKCERSKPNTDPPTSFARWGRIRSRESRRNSTCNSECSPRASLTIPTLVSRQRFRPYPSLRRTARRGWARQEAPLRFWRWLRKIWELPRHPRRKASPKSRGNLGLAAGPYLSAAGCDCVQSKTPHSALILASRHWNHDCED